MSISEAETVIEAFGGLTKTARALGHRNVTTVQWWKKSGRIPAWRRPEIRAAAKRAGLLLPASLLDDVPSTEAAA
jgi:hypothetical protein